MWFLISSNFKPNKQNTRVNKKNKKNKNKKRKWKEKKTYFKGYNNLQEGREGVSIM